MKSHPISSFSEDGNDKSIISIGFPMFSLQFIIYNPHFIQLEQMNQYETKRPIYQKPSRFQPSQFLNVKESKPHDSEMKKESYFSNIAKSQVMASNSSFKQSVSLNQVKQHKGSVSGSQSQVVSNKSMRADQFLEEAQLRDVPNRRQPEHLKQYVPDTPEKSRKEKKIVLSAQELERMIAQAKSEIKEELLEELRRQEKGKEPRKVEEEIAEEYLSQVKFKRYKEYMQDLLGYYYNHQPEMYEKVLQEYNQKLKDYALDGLVSLQKQELLRLHAITKHKVVEQNQQVELALFNQKKTLEKMSQQKANLKRDERHRILDEQRSKAKHKHVFKTAFPQEINPYKFQDEDVFFLQKEQDDTYLKKYDLVDTDMKDDQIDQLVQVWDFDQHEKRHLLQIEEQKDRDLERQKQEALHDSFESEKRRLEEEMKQFRNADQSKPLQSHQQSQSGLTSEQMSRVLSEQQN